MLIALLSITLFAQTPRVPFVVQGVTPYERRAKREAAAARVENARQLVEAYEEAADALDACSVPVAAKLAAFHSSGELSKWPDPAAFLALLGSLKTGADDVVLWAIQPANAAQLRDADAYRAYLDNSAEVSLELTPLSKLAAQARARKSAAQAATPWPLAQAVERHGNVLAALAVLAVCGFLVWRKRRQQGGPLAARQ